jgi:uncharacterized protein (TIGR00255 family)
MIKSMTAYSRASLSTPLGRLTVELHSVNRKMLDLSLYLPKDYLRFDMEIRKWLGQALERGQVTLRLHAQNEDTSSNLSHYSTQLKGLKEGWEKIARELGYEPTQTIDLAFLVSQMQTVSMGDSKEEEEKIKAALKEVIESALREFMHMKKVEGAALATDIEKRLNVIQEHLELIKLKKDEPLTRYQKKILERLKEIGHIQEEVEERVAREVALLAEKMDITEELVRLGVHLEQFRIHLNSADKSIGRTLDFLTQEMHREITTLGAKSMDSDISIYVVKMKSELDKIREQVQNIE